MDKAPVFAEAGELGPDSASPVAVTAACVVADGAALPEHDELVPVSTSPHGITTPNGRSSP
ncbi:hypothetical protein [Streptomyces globosus]|uniref:hypothetical protein n=1 Tax=Streptomyces globosus TaxID=68209 RepID=UPI0031D820AF